MLSQFSSRINRAIESLARSGADCGLAMKRENIYYLTGFFPTATCALLLKEEPLLLVSEMDAKLADKSSIEHKIVKRFDQEFKALKHRSIAVEKNFVSIDFYGKYLKGKKVHDLDFMEKMRMRKDKNEIKQIEHAIEILADAMKLAREKSQNKNSITEAELAAEVERCIRVKAKSAFETIVASGANSAIPHHSSANKKIAQGEVVLIDAGVNFNHYNSDATRTFSLGSNKKFSETHEIVAEAQKAGIKQCRAGNKIKNVDIAVRKVFKEYGVLEHFSHSSGHGIGLEVHEAPALRSDAKGKFENGMVVTVEPGIYRDFGVRIEDMVLIDGAPKILTRVIK